MSENGEPRKYSWRETLTGLQMGHMARRSAWPGTRYVTAAFIPASRSMILLLIPDKIDGTEDETGAARVDETKIVFFSPEMEDTEAKDWVMRAGLKVAPGQVPGSDVAS